MRVYALAREMGMSSKELLARLEEMGIEVSSHSSSLSDEEVEKVKGKLGQEKAAPPPEKEEAPEPKKETKEKPPPAEPEEAGEEEPREEKKPEAVTLVVRFPVTVRQLADRIGQRPNVLIKKLLALGVFATLNQFLDEETAGIVAAEYGYEIKAYAPPREARREAEVAEEEHPAMGEKEEDLRPRSPVVTLMGHIDHGKTSILDALRRSRIVSGEAGGITQHIGAYRLETEHGSVVFLDTPGHAAFTTMRARGARLTDIVVLVVAADEGIMPQTLEAIDHARAAEVPIIVALNKADKAASNPTRVRRQLAENELVPEEMGGEIICAEVSAVTKAGLKHLVEMILLQAEIMELKANPGARARGVVVEARLTPERGPVATILVKNGTLKRGDSVICGLHAGKIKGMFDDLGKPVKEAGPSVPVEVIGLSGVPEAGTILRVVEDDSEAREISQKLQEERKNQNWQDSKKVRLEDFFQKISEDETGELAIVLKGDAQGSVEAVKMSLEEIIGEEDEVKLKIIHSGVGSVTESDVMLAAASGAIIIGFQVSADGKIKQMAEAEGVDIRLYKVIYEAVDEVKQALEGLLEPKLEETVFGHARIKEIFKISKLGMVAGSVVEKGRVKRGQKVKIIREGEVVADDVITSLKRYKESVEEVDAGKECGISLGNFKDFQVGDVLECYQVEKVPQKL